MSNTRKEPNPLLAPWTGSYGGVPAFARMALDDLKPALESSMATTLDEVDAIAQNPDPPTFENTIAALERSGRQIDRVGRYWGVWSSNLSTPKFREIQGEMVPKVAQFGSAITQNQDLFARIKAVFEGDETATLRPDQQRLVEVTYDRFARKGARLEGEPKARHAAINERLAELHTEFSNYVLADEEGYVEYLTEQQLSGLPRAFVQAAAAAASERGHDGEYAITNTRSSVDPLLMFSDDRDVRRRCGAPTMRVARTATNTTTTRGLPKFSSCDTNESSCSATRTTRHGGSRTGWPKRQTRRSVCWRPSGRRRWPG